jgi:hypothetical protein
MIEIISQQERPRADGILNEKKEGRKKRRKPCGGELVNLLPQTSIGKKRSFLSPREDNQRKHLEHDTNRFSII